MSTPLDVGPSDDPVQVLHAWYARACEALPRDEAHRIALATVDADGHPSVRIVLCREIDREGGLRFYTNYESDKGRALAIHPWAAAVFHWPSLGRQLRARGRVTTLDTEASDRYWATRPRESQVSALASPQSRTIEHPDLLLARRDSLSVELGPGPIPRPPGWGGYRLEPEALEFWHEGGARLHERLLFVRDDGGWSGRYLAP